MTSCVLCGATGAMDRLAGLDVCTSCRLDGGEAGHETWSLSSTHERSTTQTGSGETSRTVDVLEVRVAFPTPLSAQAHFRRENGMDRLWEWFADTEPQGGEPLFDRAVFVEQATGEHLTVVLADEGVQSAIMELVASGGVRIGPGWVRARRSSDAGEPSLAATLLPLTLLAVHLELQAQQLPGQTGTTS